MSLIRLSEDRTLHVAQGEPQLQDFGFYSDTGDKLGSIKDLIADTDTMKVRYLIASWHEGLLERKDLIIPIRDVMIDMDAQRVICSNCTPERLRSYPEYKGGILPDLTKRFTATFVPAATETATAHPIAEKLDKAKASVEDTLAKAKAKVDETILPKASELAETRKTTDEGRLEVIEEELKVGKRDIPAGEAVIRKTVTQENVCQPVELRSEHVEVERHAVNRPTNAAPGQGPMEVHVPLMGQEVVTSKQAFVREEIILHKVVDTTQQNVCETVSKETVGNLTTSQADAGIQPVSKTDMAGDKIDVQTPSGLSEELGRPDHLFDEPRDRPL